ncbi:hypothetical protein AFLA_013455 [Aspergillus flavus NRRL3357]|nr:hypothetical protein AFLA_013455 [Aspergillus flavus NRRL3357]
MPRPPPPSSSSSFALPPPSACLRRSCKPVALNHLLFRDWRIIERTWSNCTLLTAGFLSTSILKINFRGPLIYLPPFTF